MVHERLRKVNNYFHFTHFIITMGSLSLAGLYSTYSAIPSALPDMIGSHHDRTIMHPGLAHGGRNGLVIEKQRRRN
jgi:hypothetical protein